eukprot:GHVU01197675.1.p1 GENE.GHVU01197675.1~~GHVU01197675.1.p1  ORF type:complete len:170 (-),score=29.38 GHVU01197675.1:199-708(-)
MCALMWFVYIILLSLLRSLARLCGRRLCGCVRGGVSLVLVRLPPRRAPTPHHHHHAPLRVLGSHCSHRTADRRVCLSVCLISSSSSSSSSSPPPPPLLISSFSPQVTASSPSFDYIRDETDLRWALPGGGGRRTRSGRCRKRGKREEREEGREGREGRGKREEGRGSTH